MIRKFDTAMCCISILLCLAALLALPLAADGSVSEEKYIIESFDTSYGQFRAGNNVRSVVVEKMIENGEIGESYERSCLKTVGRNADIGELRCVYADFSAPIPLGDYRSVVYSIYLPLCEEPDTVYYSRITLFSSDGSSTESLVEVEGGAWCQVEADISKWNGRSSVVSLEIACVVDTGRIKYSSEGFYLDDVYACDKVDTSVSSRFLFDKYELDGAVGAIGDGGELLITADSFDSFTLNADVFAPELLYGANALRMKISNITASDTLTVRYNTSDTQANSEDKVVTVPIKPMSGPSYYYAYVGDVSMLRSIELNFNEGGGNVEIHSISAVSLSSKREYETCGSVSICRLSDDRATVSFYGEIDRETALNNQNSRISVYTYEADILPTPEELLLLEPVVSGEMTTRFELIWRLPQDNPYACYSRFIAVIEDEYGNYSLVSQPFYIDNPSSGGLSVKESFSPDTKGFAASDVSLVGETDSGLTVLCADIGEAFSLTSDGIPFSYNGRTYYLDSEYIEGLSKKIAILKKSGVAVLLRCVGWDWQTVEELEALYGADVDDGAAAENDFVGAFGSYIADTWCTDGSVAGVIFGNGENVIKEGLTSASDMIAYTARELSKIYFSITSRNSGSRVYISVTDLMDVELSTNASEIPLSDYFTALSLESAQYGNYGWEIAVEVQSRYSDISDEIITAWDCDSLVKLLREFGWSDKNIVFCDDTYENSEARMSALIKQYVIGYYSAYFNDKVDAYIAIAGDKAEAIAEAVKCIDTTESSLIISNVASALDSEYISNTVKGYDESLLVRRDLGYSDALDSAPGNIKGTYNYFVFNSASGVNVIEPGYYCTDTHIVRDSVSALSVQLDAALYDNNRHAGWMGVFHRYEYAESFENTPVIAVTLKLQNTYPAGLSNVPVKLVLHSENGRFESVGKVPAEEWATVYFDVKNFSGIEDITSFRLLAGDGKLKSATLLVKDIKGLSDEYSDEALDEIITGERLKKRTPNEDVDDGSYLWMGGAVLLAAVTVLVVMLLSRKKGEYRE